MQKLILNAASTAQPLVDYINASNQVCRYAVGINTTQLPDLVTPPANYGDFVQAFAKANLHVMDWMDEVVPDFNQLPAAFLSYNAMFQQQAAAVQNYLQQLKADPSDAGVLQSIKSTLGTLIGEAQTSAKTVSGLDASIAGYQATVAPDAQILNGLCGQISTAEAVDQASINQMNAVLQNLQTIVDSRNELATLNTLANITEGIFVAAVGVAIGIVFTGGLALTVGLGVGFGVGSVVLTTLEPASLDIDYQQSLESIQDDMNNVNTEIGLLASTVTLLQSLNSQFGAIISKSGEAQQNVRQVLGFWQQVATDTAQVISELESALAEGNIDGAISDLTAATASWNEVEGYMRSVADLKYTINPATFLASSVPVEEAVA